MLTNSNFYIGDSSVSRLYQGENLIWDASHPDILLSYIENGQASNRPNVYFDTGVYPDSSTDVEISYQLSGWPVSGANDSAIIFGCTQTTASYSYAGDYYIGTPFLVDGTFYACRFRNQSALLCEATPDSSKHIIRTVNTASMQTLYYDDSSVSAAPTSVRTKEITAYIFSRRYNNTTSLTSYKGTRIYYCKIWEDNNLIRFYIPVLHYINGQYTPCFYDKVNNTYIYNLGTDTPTYKISGDYLLDYLGTEPETGIPTTGGYTGMQYDTGIVASTSLSVDIKGRIIWGTERNLFASATDNVTTPTWKTYGFTTSGGSTDADKCRLVFQWGANNSGTVRTFISMDSSSLVEPHRISMYHDNNNIAHGYLDDTFYTASNTSFNFSPNSIYLLNRHNNSVTTQAGPGTRVYYANFTISNIPAKTYIPVFHNNQAAFLDLNSGTYIYNMGTQIPYYQFKI